MTANETTMAICNVKVGVRLRRTRLGRVNAALAAATLSWGSLCAAPRIGVQTDTNGVLLNPTNLFLANSALLGPAVTNMPAVSNLTAVTMTNLSLSASQFVGSDASNRLVSTLNGASLTNLNAAALASGVVPAARLADGSALTNLNITVAFMPTNARSVWPTQAQTPGGIAFINSNGTPYILRSAPNSQAWIATNHMLGTNPP